jgi:sugar/nucleoside kinase (ribokinase family)
MRCEYVAESHAGRALSGVDDTKRVAAELLDHGPLLVGLEVSGQDNVFAGHGGIEFLPPLQTNLVDSTSSGDGLIATLTAAPHAGAPVAAPPRNTRADGPT